MQTPLFCHYGLACHTTVHDIYTFLKAGMMQIQIQAPQNGYSAQELNKL